ncbi:MULTISPECIES: anti-sigma factor [Priestia]|uniref:anti-sigma factor n=1 Tax=Priestia TaxID=2800373 RepID=UPI00189E858B|nr:MULTISPECIES: anti-sigma factor [Priestia]MCM3793017.1 anti-sigma factor [Priestia megaterium]
MSMCNKLIDYYNDQLTSHEKKEFEMHLKNCQSCQEELRELEEVLGDLTYLTPAQSPPPEMKQRILANVFEEDQDETKREPIALKSEKQHAASKKSNKKSIIIGLAAALLLSLAGNSYFLLKDGDKGKQEPNVSVAPQNEPLTSEKTMKLQAEPNVSGEATASLTKKGGNLNVVIQANNLKNVKGNEVYQVWLIKGDKPHPAGAFVTDKNGNGTVVYTMSQKEQTEKWDVMAITLEPNANNKTPKGNIVLSSAL